MAFHTEALNTPAKTSFASRLAGSFTALFARIADAQNRTDVVNRMQSLSDAELARMGLRRGDIVHHVYRDIYYI